MDDDASDSETWAILECHCTWFGQSQPMVETLLENCGDDLVIVNSLKKRKRRECGNIPRKPRRTKPRKPKSDEDEDDGAIESLSSSTEELKNEFSSDTELEKAEREASERIQTRKEKSQQFTQTTESIVATELHNIAESLLDCEKYEIETTGRSSLTLKKISHQIRELKHILFVECHTIIPPHLLHIFAARVFIGKREHLRNSFLFHFTHNQ